MPRTPFERRAAATLSSAALLAVLIVRLSHADSVPPPMPHSLAEAMKMEQEDALPLTAFYETPALSGSKPGALLRQEPFQGYAVPPGATAVRILYHSLSSKGALSRRRPWCSCLPGRRRPEGGR